MLSQALNTSERYYACPLDACLARGLPVVVCTIDNGNVLRQSERQRAAVAIAPSTDVILRAAGLQHPDAIDLREVRDTTKDCANSLEPSERTAQRWRRLSPGLRSPFIGRIASLTDMLSRLLLPPRDAGTSEQGHEAMWQCWPNSLRLP